MIADVLEPLEEEIGGRLPLRDELLEACGKLHDLFVDERARRHGVADALVRAVIDRMGAMGAPRVVLLTAADNTAAQSLFARASFRRTMIEMTAECERR